MHRHSLLASSVAAGSVWLLPALAFASPPDAEADTAAEVSSEADVSMGAVGKDGPGMVYGRKEPTMMTLRGPSGMFYTSTAEVGELYSVRFHLHSDFFAKNDFFCCDTGTDGDRHARVRGSVNLGFTFTKWTELYLSINNSSNRHTRDGAGQQSPTVFALGDLSFGIKGAYQFLDGGIGLGGQLGLGLLSGSERLRASKVNFDFAVLLGVDLRHLTKKHVPVRFSGNIGWQLDNSIKQVDWAAIDDELAREVLRFSLGANHSRVVTRLAVDFPIRLGKEKQYGIDPVIEYSWDISTYKENSFVELTEDFGGTQLKRSQAWLTLGLRANVYSGLFLNAGVDVGTSSPNYEYGPPTAPYQVILGLGWHFDPRPRKAAAAAVPDTALPPAVLDGRIVGRVIDVQGAPIADAKISFPDLTTDVVTTDEAGTFTSFRFPEGVVLVHVELPDGSTLEQSADVRAGEDTQIDIVADAPAVPEAPVFDGTFVDAESQPIAVTVAIDGMGIQESFQSDAAGRIAVELPPGEYKATITAEGYQSREVTFTMTEQGASMTETLVSASALPVETPLISGSKSRIKLKKNIKYDGNELDLEKSTEVLDQLAAFLAAHPEYLKVEVGVHTDDRGNPTTRSQSRAEQVVDYLVSKGVDRGRLEAKGYGAKEPVAMNITADGRAQNNRTEIEVEDYDASKAPAE